MPVESVKGLVQNPQPVLPENFTNSRRVVPLSYESFREPRVARRVEVANIPSAIHHIHPDADVVLSDQVHDVIDMRRPVRFGWKGPTRIDRLLLLLPPLNFLESVVNVKKNLPPELKFEFPAQDYEVTSVQELPIEGEVFDDVGVSWIIMECLWGADLPLRSVFGSAAGLMCSRPTGVIFGICRLFALEV